MKTAEAGPTRAHQRGPTRRDATDALVRVTTSTTWGTDLHILKRESRR